jgi:NAD+ diphosphatase
MAWENFYGQSGLNRMSERRSDRDWVRRQLGGEGTRIIPVWRAMNLVSSMDDPVVVHLGAADVDALLQDGMEPVFLGIREGIAHFSIDVSHIEEPAEHASLGGRGEFVELRNVGALLSRDEGSVLAYARALAHWHRQHRFCGACGAPNQVREAGHMLLCSDPDCATPHFPRTDPAVIMLVTKGDQALMGRKSEWPEDQYSALAGFVEPGESLEGAVAREVMEEAGIAISNVRYQSSQPWPFPASLMLGFYATAETTDIRINRDELEDARWFSRAELKAGGGGMRRRRRSDSIARKLITDWVEAE